MGRCRQTNSGPVLLYLMKINSIFEEVAMRHMPPTFLTGIGSLAAFCGINDGLFDCRDSVIVFFWLVRWFVIGNSWGGSTARRMVGWWVDAGMEKKREDLEKKSFQAHALLWWDIFPIGWQYKLFKVSTTSNGKILSHRETNSTETTCLEKPDCGWCRQDSSTFRHSLW